MAAKQKKQTKKQKKQKLVKKPTILNAFNYVDRFWQKNIFVIPLFIGLSFLIYFQCIPFGYVLDDQIVISDNNYTKKGVAGLWDIFANESFEGYFGEQKDLVQGGRYRPLSIMMFAVEYAISPANTKLNHFINIFLYGLCCLLLFRVLSQILPQKEEKWYLTLAFCISLLFLVHAVHVEAVANIKGRDEILAMIFGMSALHFSINYIKSKSIKDLIFMSVLFYLGLLSKENVLTFLGVIPMTLLIFTKGLGASIRKVFGLLAIITIAYLFQRYLIIGYLINTNPFTDVMNNPFADMNGAEKYATIFYTLLKYIGLSIIPHPLTHDYYPYHIPIMNWGKPSVLLSFLLHGLLFFYALLNWKKQPIISWSLLFYLFTISIVSNIIFGVGTFMNERFIFISSLGMITLLVYLFLHYLPERWPAAKSVGYGLVGFLFGFYAYKSFERVPVWESALSLNTAAVEVSKNSARANSFMATALYQESLKGGNPEEVKDMLIRGKAYADHALSIIPNYKNANIMKAGIAGELHKKGGSLQELLQAFREVGSVRPSIEFIEQYCDYLADRRDHFDEVKEFYYDLGWNVLNQEKNSYNYALKYLKKAYSMSSTDPRIRKAMSHTHRMLGNTAEAKRFE